MEAKKAGPKKVPQCWWFDSHNSAKRTPWLQSTLSELEKKTKGILNLIEGDADSFAQRAEMYYKKRPELLSLIEDFYRSYRYLAEQHELLRSETGTRRSTSFKSDSLNQSSSQKAWDSTEVDDYPESDVSEVDDPEPEDAHQIESILIAASEEFKSIMKKLEAELPVQPLIFDSSAAESYKSEKIPQMETDDHELEHQDVIKLMEEEVPVRKENDQNIMMSMNEGLEVCSNNTRSLSLSPSDFPYSNELDDYKSDDLETKVLFEKIVDNVAKLTSEVENLKMEKETLMAELEMKDEEKRHVIRQLSLSMEIMKEENVILKKFIKNSRKYGSIFEIRKLKEAFSGTRRLFGLTSRFQPSLVAL